MRRVHVAGLAGLACLLLTVPVGAQMGQNFFPRPSIAGAIHPEVGKGAIYETTRQGNEGKDRMEMTVVGIEKIDGKDGFWFEFAREDKQTGKPSYGKILFSKDDFEIHRLIVQRDGQPATEIPFHMSDPAKQKLTDGVTKWEPVGAETVTVPGGTFVCQHWKSNGNDGGDIWTSDLVSPFGVVKEVTPTRTMILVKLITEAQEHITGPVKQFDPQAMRQQMMDRMQQQQKQPNR
jgi:hypothetical protein